MDLLRLLMIAILVSGADLTVKTEHFREKLKRKRLFSARQNLQVTTQNGIVRGLQAYTIDTNKTYYAFFGIPYAQIPTGDLRFQPPAPTTDWRGVYNATYERSMCVQTIDHQVLGSEDCLYINVYTPELPSANSRRFPVMVWIYGGSFINGDGNYSTYGPDYLLDEDVVVVTFNYRLGLLGFLSTGDLVVPGNNGLRDQILALKWVQKNIAAFGGNPNNVTVFGESAGAASVSYLLLSPLTTGLYKRAILQSGTSLCLWSLSRKAKQQAFATGQALGINTNDSTVLVNGLRNVSYQRLQQASDFESNLIAGFGNPLDGLIIAPVLEPNHPEAVVASYSYELLQRGFYNQVPLLMGFNSEEGNYFASFVNALKIYLITYDWDVKRLVPIDMNIDNSTVESQVGEMIKQHYVGASGSFLLNTSESIHYLSDDQFVRSIRQYVKVASESVDVYYYELTYEGRLGNPNRTLKGVGHSEDLNYIFRTNQNYPNLTVGDRNTRYRMVRLWTNFAKFGNPTPISDSLLQNITWSQASTTQNLTFLNIGTNLTLQTDPRPYDMNFWDYLYEAFSKGPYGTY